MNQICKKCSTSNLSNARFCQGCGNALAATSVGGRTIVLPPAGMAMTVADEKTIVQMARRTFGNATAAVDGFTMARGDPGQREQTVIVLDRSGSMAENYEQGVSKMQAAIIAAVNFIENKGRFDAEDHIAIVAFNEKAEVLQEFLPIRTYRQKMIQILQSLEPDDGTDINEGLVVAKDLFDWNQRRIVRRIVLLTDGHGGDPLDTAADLKSRGVVLDIVGIGKTPSTVDEELLKKVASVIGGQLRYRFVKDSRTLVSHYTQLANKTATK